MRERLAAQRGLFGQGRQMAFHVAAIMQAGQRVRDRHLDRVLHIVAQMIGVAALADLGAGARQQFVAVDRTGEIVVDADLEAAQQPRIVVGIGDGEDRQLPRAFQRARLAAQPKPVEILQTERDDQEVVTALGGVEQRFGRIGLDVDGMLGAQHLRQPLIGRSPVVDQQDASAPARIGDRVALRRLHADLERGDGAHAQFVGHHLQPRQRAHPRDQHDVGDRLGQEIVGAGVKPAHAVGGAVERGDHDHGNEMGGRIRLQAAADLETVHVRHHHVEQDDVAFGALGRSPAPRRRSMRSARRNTRPTAVLPAASHWRGRRRQQGYARSLKCTPYPINRRTVSMNLPTEIGLER